MLNPEFPNADIILSDADKRSRAESLVLQCGVRLDLNGGCYLIDSVMLFAANPVTRVTYIYDAIGEYRNIQSKTVLREIRYAIVNAFDLSENLYKLVGIRIPANQIHNSIVISYLGKLLQGNRKLFTPQQ